MERALPFDSEGSAESSVSGIAFIIAGKISAHPISRGVFFWNKSSSDHFADQSNF